MYELYREKKRRNRKSIEIDVTRFFKIGNYTQEKRILQNVKLLKIRNNLQERINKQYFLPK